MNKKALFWSVVISLFIFILLGGFLSLLLFLPTEVVYWVVGGLIFLFLFIASCVYWYKELTK
jgi:hypothetical protein